MPTLEAAEAAIAQLEAAREALREVWPDSPDEHVVKALNHYRARLAELEPAPEPEEVK